MIRGYLLGESPLVDCSVRLPGLSTDVPIGATFLVDTGAAVNLLHPRDTARLGVDLAGLAADRRAERAMSLSGLTRFIRTTALLEFEEDTPRVHGLRHPLGIVEATSANQTLPSILGMDFIQNFRLIVSVRENRVELEPMFDDA